MTEVMVTTVIGSIILAGILTTYIHTGRAFRAISNYWEIHTQGRYAIERFAADMRGVYGINQFVSNSTLQVSIPTVFNAQGSPVTLKTVTYTFNNGALWRRESTDNLNVMLATNIYSLSFRLYDRIGNRTTVVSTSKAIQLDLYLRKYTANQAQTEDYLSARLDMRNKP
jgi:Tfp pilus assembly protein PilW